MGSIPWAVPILRDMKYLKNEGTSLALACTQTLFYNSFRSLKKKSASEESARERARILALAVNKPLRFIFYHPRSNDHEEKIEGL